jgi:hypothetical protein
MKNIFTILNSLKKLFAYGDRVHPARDWFVLLISAMLLLIASVGWNVYLFNQFQNEKGTADATQAKTSAGVGDSITQAQAIFQQRATEEQNYQKNYSFVDPSRSGS